MIDELRVFLLPPQPTINLIIDKADHKAQHAADKEADGIFDSAVIFDIDHDQFDDADHGQNQSV